MTTLTPETLAALRRELANREQAIIEGVLQTPDYPPLPPCPQCSTASEEITSRQEDDWDTRIQFKPCGHTFHTALA